MKRSGVLVAGVGIAWIAAAIFLSTGCTATDRDAAAAVGSDVGGASPDVVIQAGDELQSIKEKEMVKLFRLLLKMDAEPELSIGKEQAESMLPLIRRIVAEGTLLPVDEQAIVALLREEQKAYFQARQDRLKPKERTDQRENEEELQTENESEIETEIGNGTGEIKEEDQDRKSHTQDSYIKHKEQGPKPTKDINQKVGDQPGAVDWAAGEISLEQQLMERLEGKLDR